MQQSSRSSVKIALLRSLTPATHAAFLVLVLCGAGCHSKPSASALQGQVVAINPAWNFAILDVGSQRGARLNEEVTIQRGETQIGKVRITNVQPANSVADFIRES